MINPQLSHETMNHINRHFEQRGDMVNRNCVCSKVFHNPNCHDPHPYAVEEFKIHDRWGKIIKNGKFE